MKKFILSLILAITLIASPVSAKFLRDVIVTSPDAIWTDSRAYATLADAITAVGANEREIVIAKEEVCVALTIPANVHLKFTRDGSITNSGQLIINTQNISAGDYQIFTGTGDIDFVSGSIVRSTWFSNLDEAFDVTNDDTLVIIISEAATTTADMAVGNNVSLRWDSPFIITSDVGHTVSNIKNIEAGDYQIFAGAGEFNFLAGTILNSVWFSHLKTAIDYIGTDEVTLEITQTETIDDDRTVNANTSLKVLQGGMISIDGGVTLFDEGLFTAPLTQVIGGVGEFVYNGNSVWFTDWRGTNSASLVIDSTNITFNGNIVALGNVAGIGGAVKIQDTFTCSNVAEQCIHGHRPIVGNYIYFGTESFRVSVAKLWKVNLDDFSDTSSITFPVDVNHVGVSDVQYSKNNDKLYVAFRNSGYIAEVDPYTFAGYTDVITNGTNLLGTAIWIEGDYLYQIAQTNPTKLYKYDLTDYSLSASNLTINPANGHALITNGDYLYAVNGAFGQQVTVWKFNKSDLSLVISKTYLDMYGGSHDIVAVNDEYLFFGLHGFLVDVGINGFVRIDIDDFNSYDHVTLPSDLVGPVVGCTYHNDYIWLTQLGRPGALIRVDPDSLNTEIYRFPCTYPDYLGDYYYANGPVVFDDKDRAYSSFMPDFWEDELNVPAYLSQYTLSDFYRPYDTQDIIVKKDDNPYISVIDTANLVTTHDVTIDVDNGAVKGTITASAGTPYSDMYDGQVFELSETLDNNEVYTIDSVTDTVITTTAVISGGDYSGNCAVRARQSNRVFMQAHDDRVTIGGSNTAYPENAKMKFYVGDTVKAYITGGTGHARFFLTTPTAAHYSGLYLQSNDVNRMNFLANNAESLIYYHDDNSLQVKTWPGEDVRAFIEAVTGDMYVRKDFYVKPLTGQASSFIQTPVAGDYARLYLQSNEITRIALMANDSESVFYTHDDNPLYFKIWPSEVVRVTLSTTGKVGIGTNDPKSMLHVVGLPVYANNAAAVVGGLTAGAFYRTGGNPDPVCVVH